MRGYPHETAKRRLIYLCKEAANLNIEFKKKLKDCAYVNQYYIETRYPSDVPLIVTDEEAVECIFITEEIYKLALGDI